MACRDGSIGVMPARYLWEHGSILPRRIELLRIVCVDEALCSHDPVGSRVLAGCVLGFLCIPCSVPTAHRQPRSGAGLRMQKDQSIHMPKSDEPVRMSPFPCLVAPERDALTIILDGEQATMIPPTGAGPWACCLQVARSGHKQAWNVQRGIGRGRTDPGPWARSMLQFLPKAPKTANCGAALHLLKHQNLFLPRHLSWAAPNRHITLSFTSSTRRNPNPPSSKWASLTSPPRSA